MNCGSGAIPYLECSIESFLCIFLRVQERNLGGYGGELPPTTLKICLFAGQKRYDNVLLQGNLQDPAQLANYCY